MKEDWVECRLGDICSITMGQSPPSSSYNSNREGLPFFQGKAEFTDKYPIQKIWCNAPKKIAYPNNILLSVRAPVGSTNIANQKCCIGRGLASISYSYNINFIWYFLKKNEVNLDAKGTGTTFKSISKNVLQDFPIPLPPLPIQRAIVSKIETLFTSLDKGIADLQTAQEQLKIYRQAVLKKAFEGELTRKWRSNHPYTLDKFLLSLKKSKEEAIKNKLILKGNYFPEINDSNKTFNTPNEWINIPWKTITSNNRYALKRGPFGSALKKEFFVEKGIVVYEQGHAINDDPYRHRYYISKDKYNELKAFTVKGGDMIISCSGVTLGRICLLPDNAEIGIINQALLKVEIDENIILKRFFIRLFRSETFQRLIFQKSLGTAMPNMVGLEELREILIPIPSLPEQNQIFLEIEKRLSVCDKLEESISESLEKAKALRQSILKKAFEGKLLTPDEIEACKKEKDYEPAGELLKKIKLEKEKVV